MWQRPQTIYMVFSIMMLMAALFFPAFSGELSNGNLLDLFVGKLLEKQPISNQPLRTKSLSLPMILLAAPALNILVAIFLYLKRPLQARLLWTVILFQVAALGVLAYLFSKEVGVNAILTGIRGGTVLILASILLDWMAIRLIQKDEKMVRGSRDRLR